MSFSETATLAGVFEEQANRYPERPFVAYPDKSLSYTYREFNARANRLAKGLIAIGIRKGDHVGLWAANVPDWVTYMFATAKMGAVLIPINISYRAAELEYVLKQSDMKALVIAAGFKGVNFVETVYGLAPQLRQQDRRALQCDAFPCLRNVVYMGEENLAGMFTTSDLLRLGEEIADEELALAAAAQRSDDVINMQYTSGTTGFPKGVMLSHRNTINNGFYLGEGQKYTEKDRLCLAVPLFHCFGIVLGVVGVMTHGGSMVILETFAPLEALKAIEKEKCTAFHGVPAMFIALLSHPDFSKFDLSSLRTGIMAGSPCPEETMKRVISQMHCSEITIGYGLTEAAPGITQTRKDDPVEKRVSTVGKPLPEIEVKIVDLETGRRLGVNEPGELCCRGYNVMKGYYKMPEATAQAIDADAWLHTGDQATLDEDGYYRITGRIKDVIIQGGENIYPREIEEVLHTMPGVRDVQVVGVPHPRLGESPAAVVILENGIEPNSKALRDFCKGRLARFKVPRYVLFVDEYPSTANGKVQKYKLREMVRKRLGIEHDVFEGQ